MEKHHKVKGAQQDKAHIQLALIVLEVCEEWSQGGSVSSHASTMKWVSEHILNTAYERLKTKNSGKFQEIQGF